MELTFEQQVIVAVIGGVVASILTSILNNWWTDRRLRDQWEREKEERLEQWRREQEARKREWKREYRKEVLHSYLEKVNRVVFVAAYQASAKSVLHDQRDKLSTTLFEAAEDIISATIPWGGDRAFLELQQELSQAIGDMQAAGADKKAVYHRIRIVASGMYARVEKLLEETFD